MGGDRRGSRDGRGGVADVGVSISDGSGGGGGESVGESDGGRREAASHQRGVEGGARSGHGNG